MRRHTGSRSFGTPQLDQRVIPGLVGHWMGGGSGLSWRDLSGYQNDAVFTGSPKWTIGGIRSDRSAVQLVSGGTDLLNCGSPSIFDDVATLTLTAWVYSTSFADEQQIVAKLSVAYSGWTFYIAITTGVLGWFQSATDSVLFETNQAVTLNRWTHVAFSRSVLAGAPSGVFYLDGVLCTLGADQQGTGAVSDAAQNLTIGSREADGSGMAGIIDDVRVYNRVLSQVEISLLASPSFYPVVAVGRRACKTPAAGWGPLLGGSRARLVVAA